MGEAKRRASEIAEIKKKPREPRKRVKRTLGKAKTEQVWHFRSAAARAAAMRECVTDGILNNSDKVTRAVTLGQIKPDFVQAIPLKIFTPVEIEPSRKPRVPQPFPIVIGAKKEELAHYVAAMANISPKGNGFRQPSAKEKNWRSTSLVEKLSIAHLGAEPNKFKRSERGEKKLQARIEGNAAIVLDRLIEQFPDRARQAKSNERLVNWFVAKVQETCSGDIDPDWLLAEVKAHIQHPREQKYLHARQRARNNDMREAA